MSERVTDAEPTLDEVLAELGMTRDDLDFGFTYRDALHVWRERELRRAAEHIGRRASWFCVRIGEWLEFVADVYKDDPYDYCAGEGHPIYPEKPEPCSSWWCANVDKALAAARAYNREHLGGGSVSEEDE